MTPTIGRSHGIHAEPMTFGLELAGSRGVGPREDRLDCRPQGDGHLAISGAVGTIAHLPAHRGAGRGRIGLRPRRFPRRSSPATATRCSMPRSASSPPVERLAIESATAAHRSAGSRGVLHGRSKRLVRDAAQAQPGLTENLTGLSRMVRAYVTPALENVALWHERDISHSSVERMIAPDATVTLAFALARLAVLIDKLVVYPENMKKNLDRLGGLIHSQRVMLALTQKGASREDAYRLVQRNAMPVWRGEGDFLTLLKADKDVKKLLSEPRSRRTSTSASTSSTSIRSSSACLGRAEQFSPGLRPPTVSLPATVRVLARLSPCSSFPSTCPGDRTDRSNPGSRRRSRSRIQRLRHRGAP